MATVEDLNSLNYTVLVPYNGTGAAGGDSMTVNLNVFYNVCSFAVVPLTACAMPMLMLDSLRLATLHGS